MIKAIVVKVHQAEIPSRFQACSEVSGNFRAFSAVIFKEKPDPDKVKQADAFQGFPRVVHLKINACFLAIVLFGMADSLL
jgi:hypothetical protein